MCCKYGAIVTKTSNKHETYEWSETVQGSGVSVLILMACFCVPVLVRVRSVCVCACVRRAYRIGRYCPLCERSFIGPKGTMQLVICKLCDRQLHQGTSQPPTRRAFACTRPDVTRPLIKSRVVDCILNKYLCLLH